MTPAKILVVDDEQDIVRMLMMRLRAAGYEVVTANTGTVAIRMAEMTVPDLLILDIGMPDADGHVVASRLQENTKTSRIPIIFLSARTSEKDRTLAYKAGVCRYLTKPFKPEELLATVSRALSCVRPIHPDYFASNKSRTCKSQK